jgi:glucose-1-phosphatase
MSAIKNIIFDLGGVLLDIDFNKTAEAFKKLGTEKFEELYSQNAAHHIFEDLETGKIQPETFYAQMQQYCRPGTTPLQIQAAWNEILLGFRTSSLAFLESLKTKYNIFLLSNTNAIHKTEFDQMLKKITGHSSLDYYFIKAYYSHLMHLRKPYVEAYNFVLTGANISATETLFIDDSVTNIAGANEIGLQTHLLLPSERIEKLGL